MLLQSGQLHERSSVCNKELGSGVRRSAGGDSFRTVSRSTSGSDLALLGRGKSIPLRLEEGVAWCHRHWGEFSIFIPGILLHLTNSGAQTAADRTGHQGKATSSFLYDQNVNYSQMSARSDQSCKSHRDKELQCMTQILIGLNRSSASLECRLLCINSRCSCTPVFVSCHLQTAPY